MKQFFAAGLIAMVLVGCAVAASPSSAAPVSDAPLASATASTPDLTATPPPSTPTLVVILAANSHTAVMERILDLWRDTGADPDLCIGTREPQVDSTWSLVRAQELLAQSEGVGLMADPSFYRGSSREDAARAFGAFELVASTSDLYTGWIIRRAANERLMNVPDGKPIAFRLHHHAVDGQDIFSLDGDVVGAVTCHADGT